MLIPSPGKGEMGNDEKLCYIFIAFVILSGLVYLIFASLNK